LGTIAYPDQFKDISMPNEVKKYWQEILGFSLTDDDVEGILNPPISTGGGNGGGQGTGQGQK